MLLLGITLLTAVIQGSAFPPKAEATELSPARFSTGLTAMPDRHDLGSPAVAPFVSSADPTSRDDGAVSDDGTVADGEPEAAASDADASQLYVTYEKVTSFGLCWWYCTKRDCPCLVIYF